MVRSKQHPRLPLALAAALLVGFSPSRVTAASSSRALLGASRNVGGFANLLEAYRGGEFNLTTSAATPFVQKLLASARDISNAERITFAGDGDVIPLEVQRSLCEGRFLRGGADSGFSPAEVDGAYAAAYPQHGNGLVPIGCVEGCIIGSGVFEGIARYYGIARTLTPSSWQGKCFSQDASPVPANPPNSYLPGTKVTNRIKVNYGVFINRLLGLDEPLTLYEGKTRMGESWFAEGEDAVIVEYDVETHEFTGFRDELREVYPGAYIGKMYALPGASLWNGAFEVPEGEPAFTVNFMVFAKPGGNYMSAVGAPLPAGVSK